VYSITVAMALQLQRCISRLFRALSHAADQASTIFGLKGQKTGRRIFLPLAASLNKECQSSFHHVGNEA
jgi:hypothetical protein